MKIKLLSDLHFEFHDMPAEKVFPDLADQDFDVLVLAGDIGVFQPMDISHFRGNEWARQRCVTSVVKDLAQLSGRPVVYVTGNHEYFGYGPPKKDYETTIRDVDARIAEALAGVPLVHFLYTKRPSATIGGVTFHGSTGWYPDAWLRAQECDWIDFAYVSPAEVTKEHDAWRRYLSSNLKEGDIAVSHMLPCAQAISPRWKGDGSNCFFNSGMDKIIADKKPAAWLFGHTHDSVSEVVDHGDKATALYANPYGYWPRTLNQHFGRMIRKGIVEILG